MFVKPPIELSWSHTQAIEGLKFIGSQVLTAWEQGVSVALESTRIGNKSISKENPFIWLEQSMQKYKYATTYKMSCQMLGWNGSQRSIVARQQIIWTQYKYELQRRAHENDTMVACHSTCALHALQEPY